MSKINWVRVVLGGLVAGVAIGVFAAVLIPLFSGAWESALSALGAGSPATTPGLLALGVVMQFALGITAVWLYAAIRPRYGPGPVTALIAGTVMWLVAGLAHLTWVAFTGLTFAQLAAVHGPFLVAVIVSTMAGAWVYREAEASAGAAAAPAASHPHMPAG